MNLSAQSGKCKLSIERENEGKRVTASLCNYNYNYLKEKIYKKII